MNKDSLKLWAGPFVYASLLGLAVSVLTMFLRPQRHPWHSHHTLGLILVAGCFSTEIVYFFGVFRTYKIISDWTIVDELYKTVFLEE